MDETWFELKHRKSVVQKIVDIIATATDCSEFKECSDAYLSQDFIPPMAIDFWYYGCRPGEKDYNPTFMQFVRRKLEDQINSDTKMSADGIDSKWASHKNFDRVIKDWLFQTKEKENFHGNSVEDYLPCVDAQSDFLFQSLTTQIAFCQDTFDDKKKFALLPSVQMPCNNRDVDLDYCTNRHYQGKEPKMFEYVSFQHGTEDNDQSRWSLSEGHCILVERKRRNDVDQDLGKLLSSYTTMFDLATTDTKARTRYHGVKTVGDHVGVTCTFETASKLFEILTVSVIRQSENRKFAYRFSETHKFKINRERNQILWRSSITLMQ